MTLKSDAKFEEKLTFAWKMTGILQIITRALESVEIGTLIGSYYTKWNMYDLKICRDIMCHDNEE